MGHIRFPHLGLDLKLGTGITIGNFEIRFYGIIIAIGLIAGALLAYRGAKKTGQKVDDYIDFTFFAVIGALLFARIYYVVFEWDYYSKHLNEIFDIRGGGIAIYGAVIGGAITLLIFTKVKKLSFFKMADTIVPGLLIGQIIGRWGNFFNREAFGCYTDNFLAMQIPLADVGVGNITEDMITYVNGVQYVQVHPTFLYESFLNLVLLILILVFAGKKKFQGETLCRYLVGYGIIRYFVEGFRTDQLQFGNGIAASQVVAIITSVVGLFFIIFMNIKLSGTEGIYDPVKIKVTEETAKEELQEEDVQEEDAQEEDVPQEEK